MESPLILNPTMVEIPRLQPFIAQVAEEAGIPPPCRLLTRRAETASSSPPTSSATSRSTSMRSTTSSSTRSHPTCGHHHMALFISFALSLTVIPVLWAVSQWAPNLLWYSYLIAYFVEGIAIFILHRHSHISFTLSQN